MLKGKMINGMVIICYRKKFYLTGNQFEMCILTASALLAVV